MTVARYAVPALAALAALAIAAPVGAQDRVGVTSAVNPAAQGTPPGQATRTLLLGTDVVFNERIATEAAGQTELLFLDRSSFSIGPNSDLVIDQFVYDPAAGTGKLAASAAKGVFRFVGGALSKNPDGVAIRTPTATIGLRGGICAFSIAPNGALRAVLIYGRSLSVTAQGVTQRTSLSNHMITLEPGQPPASPAPAPPGTTTGFLSQLDGRPGVTGGVAQAPTGATFQRSAVAENNSLNQQRSTTDARTAGTKTDSAPPSTNVA